MPPSLAKTLGCEPLPAQSPDSLAARPFPSRPLNWNRRSSGLPKKTKWHQCPEDKGRVLSVAFHFAHCVADETPFLRLVTSEGSANDGFSGNISLSYMQRFAHILHMHTTHTYRLGDSPPGANSSAGLT